MRSKKDNGIIQSQLAKFFMATAGTPAQFLREVPTCYQYFTIRWQGNRPAKKMGSVAVGTGVDVAASGIGADVSVGRGAEGGE